MKQTINEFRQQLKACKLDGFIVPKTDEYHSEYVAPYAERLGFLTGFTGSAGTAIVTQDKVALFVDGRYTLQAAQQVNGDVISVVPIAEVTPQQWLRDNVKPGQRIGFDPWLHSRSELDGYGIDLVACEGNPVDEIWGNQPSRPGDPIVSHDVKYAGQSHNEKINAIARDLDNAGVDYLVLTLLDSIAWLLNIRSKDIPNTPVVMAFAVLGCDQKLTLFVDADRVDDELRSHLGDKVSIKPREQFTEHLSTLGGKTVQVDGATTPFKVIQVLRAAKATVIDAQDPVILPKACKNPVEIAGTTNAHVRDGAALTNFLAWMSKTLEHQELSEIEAASKLLEFRSQQQLFQGRSFPTISGAGANGAIIHYMVTEKTNAKIKPDMLYLVDSGGQYLDGTTDVTRVLAVGTPTKEQKQRFTLVLKGHIALAGTVFPAGTSGAHLDAFARRSLWQYGLDYGHGTGHGVGSYLCVHEGPQSISRSSTSTPLRSGMIVSIEPGYYKTNEYGIRIENLAVVEEKPGPVGSEIKLLGFRILTMAPIALELVDSALLTASEKQWLNDYHTQVRTTLMPLVDEETKQWLEHATRELK